MTDNISKEQSLVVFEQIENKIYTIRGQKVMTDKDLAEIYSVETKVLKQAVRRNRHRFPDDFLFELTLEETRQIEYLRSQIATLDKDSLRSQFVTLYSFHLKNMQ